jgi:hypothetical protein
MPNIQALTLADRPLVNTFLARYPPRISELTFTNLFVWRRTKPAFFTKLDNSLLFFTKNSNKDNQYLLLGDPVGPVFLPSVIEEFGARLAGALRLTAEAAGSMQRQGYRIISDRDNSDYVYSVRDLAGLAGRRYAKKRNQIKHCLQRYHCVYEPIGPKNISECLAMQDGWCHIRNCGYSPGLTNENLAISELFANYAALDNLIGGAIRVDGEIMAYAVGEELQPATAVCHFEKSIPDIAGLGQLINQWFSKHGLRGFDYVNREQDLGIPGLRQAKESYFPHHMVDKYSLLLD